MTRYSPPMAGADPKAVVTGIHALLRGEQAGAPDALGWASVCVRSESCVRSVRNVNPMMMVRIARMRARVAWAARRDRGARGPGPLRPGARLREAAVTEERSGNGCRRPEWRTQREDHLLYGCNVLRHGDIVHSCLVSCGAGYDAHRRRTGLLLRASKDGNQQAAGAAWRDAR